VFFWTSRASTPEWTRLISGRVTSPQKIIADGTDWRFLTELKRELKV
jgi:hypothetical protein